MNAKRWRRTRTIARTWPCLAGVLLIPAIPSAGEADTPAVDVRTWSASSDPRANLVLEPASTVGPWAFAAGAILRYERDPVVLRGPQGVVATPLRDVVGVDLVSSLGLGSWAQVGLRLPAMLESGTGGLPSGDVSSGQVPSSALGDLALLGKTTLRGNDSGGFGVAVLGEVTVPTGARTSFASDAGPTATLRLLADASMRVASLQASLGYQVRTAHTTWPAPPLAGDAFGDTIPWTVGLLLRPGLIHVIDAIDRDRRQSWEVALHGSLPAGPVAPFGLGGGASAPLSPILLGLSDRVGLGRWRDLFVLAGLEVGIGPAVGVPAVRATVGVGFRFGGHDADGDGVPDDVDRCPDLPEDRDGFEDDDGCPEADNDADGIVDAMDACPNVPGPASGDPRKNGCPPAPPPAETSAGPFVDGGSSGSVN